MAKRKETGLNQEELNQKTDAMQVVDIRDKAEEAFDNYAKELLLERAFPDYRDGLTPVQRRIVYGMNQLGLSYKGGKPARQMKSARIVGDVMGKYHPHSDCVRGNTLLHTVDGRYITIQQATEQGLELEIYAVDTKGKVVTAQARAFRIGQYADEIYHVGLNTGEVIVATGNHPFLTDKLEWVRAEDIKVNQALYTVSEPSEHIENEEHNKESEEAGVYVVSRMLEKVNKEPMYDFTVDGYENMLFPVNVGSVEDGVPTRKVYISLHNSAIYGALAKMSKDWYFLHQLIEMIGNNGSSDGDREASMRYTLARLSPVASYLTKGLNKKGLVDWKLTYEDTDYEPQYLPAQFPNLLVNGSVGGIAIGYVVDVLPHNLEEVLRLSIQEAKGEELDKIAPDFPTGGIIVNGKDLADMYEKGIGSVTVRGRYRVEEDKTLRKNKRKVVFYDVPYTVQKTRVVEGIQELINNNGTSSKKQLSGAVKVQDESGSEGLRIAVTVDDEADIEVLTEIIYKYTQLEKSQRYEFLTVVGGEPRRLSLKRYLNEFNKFRRETIVREKVSDNLVIQAKLMRLDALIMLDGIRDEVIACIRDSGSRAEALVNMVNEFGFSEEQADYLLSLQLSRLTKDNYQKYREDKEELLLLKARNEELVQDEAKVNAYMIQGYEAIIGELGEPRRTEVIEEVAEVDLTVERVIPLEDVMVGVTPDGQIKRSTVRSYNATQSIDFSVMSIEATTHQEVLVFTDKGKVALMPVKDIPEMRWGDVGEALIKVSRNFHVDERVIGVGIKDRIGDIVVITNSNRIKVMLPTEFEFKVVNTFYTIMPMVDKDLVIVNGKEEPERIMGIDMVTPDTTIVVQGTNKKGTIEYGLAFKASEVSPTGRSAKGRKLASISSSKVVTGVYTSSELADTDYREVGKALVKGVLARPLSYDKGDAFVSETMRVAKVEEDVVHLEHDEQEEVNQVKSLEEVNQVKG